ncbi:MAG: hypothetical protein ACKVQK_18945 [Burkholderiales bacterium]
MTTVDFTGSAVGLIVRGKTSPAHAPGNMEQHADCVLSDGSPIGFFGEGGANTGASARQDSWNVVGMNMKGVVYDYNLLRIHRPFYIDAALARTYDVKSTLLVIDVTPPIAALFAEYWRTFQADAGGFHILGGNCSTRSSGAFVYAKILPGGIPGLDTPDNLFRQLVAERKGSTKSYSGYIGFTAKTGGGYSVLIDAP